MKFKMLFLFFTLTYSYALAELNAHNVDSKVTFMLFTRLNPKDYQIIELNNTNFLDNTNFDLQKATKILIHGWLDTYQKPFALLNREAYLEEYDANVVVVDWGPLAGELYPLARWAVSDVADTVVRFLELLLGSGVTSQSLHIVGHSLGAHIAGIAGVRINVTLPRITGLDPAGPMFYLTKGDQISQNSAEFVDIVHSCGFLLGIHAPMGHADFYPNGGTPIQPGCGFDINGQCSHVRSTKYFAESIKRPGAFVSLSCSSWDDYLDNKCDDNPQDMGEHVTNQARGTYYLKTASQSPYGLGKPQFLVN